jgi:hypothetical protein
MRCRPLRKGATVAAAKPSRNQARPSSAQDWAAPRSLVDRGHCGETGGAIDRRLFEQDPETVRAPAGRQLILSDRLSFESSFRSRGYCSQSMLHFQW